MPFLEVLKFCRYPRVNPSDSYVMRRTSRTGLDFMSGGVCSIAHPNMDDKYLRRLFAAPGLSFFKSRSVLTVCDVSRCSGQKPAGLPSFAIEALEAVNAVPPPPPTLAGGAAAPAQPGEVTP
jgi:hypothetical protein